MSQGPAVPAFIFRGHASAVHALHFFGSNLYLASGDSEGWIVVWSLATKRPVAVWKAHDGGIMGLNDWNFERLISHGRDHSLRVWQLRSEDYNNLSIHLPIDGANADEARQPWLLHSMPANALNYCAFSMCGDPDGAQGHDDSSGFKPLLIATPNGLDAGGINVFHLPSERRVCKLPSDKNVQTGMVMAVCLFEQPTTRTLTLIAGYESGHLLTHLCTDRKNDQWMWQTSKLDFAHSQPVLSVDVCANGAQFASSSADSIIGRFDLVSGKTGQYTAAKVQNTKHAGQQDLKFRDDGRILATAGWDKRIRVYSTKTLKELAVLKWHQEGCYAVAFARTDLGQISSELDTNTGTSLTKTTVDLLKDERKIKAQNVHWLAAGGKDAKISLWSIY